MQGKRSALQGWYTNEVLNDPRTSWATFSARENRARNVLKHLDGTSPDVPEVIDLREAAAMMIYRACTNYSLLGYRQTKRMRVFNRWFGSWAA
jgi:hypothetical protein